LSQLALVTRQQTALTEWGRVQIGYLKAIRIDRRNLISYVANKLGGVHYDSDRPPANKADARQFKVMATAYDWNDQAIMHAGLVATALACVEIANCAPLVQLCTALGSFHRARQERLWKGEAHALKSQRDK
jgi:hypothetical protein